MHDDGDRARVRLHEGADPRRPVRGRDAHQRGRGGRRGSASAGRPCARPSSGWSPRACCGCTRSAARSSSRSRPRRSRASWRRACSSSAMRSRRSSGGHRGCARAWTGRIARQEDLAARDATPAFVEADREFHRIFVAAAGNPILLALYDSLRDRQSRMGSSRSRATPTARGRSSTSTARSSGPSAPGTRRAPSRSSRRTSGRPWRCCAPPRASPPRTRPPRAPPSRAVRPATAGRTRATRGRSRSRRRRR